jgi:predicted dehydrogenase
MKVLVVGCGSIGRRHAANAASLATAGVYDETAGVAEACAKECGARAFSRLDEALRWKPRAVVVATPHRSHLEVAARAIAAGADVLIEKPLSHSLEGVADFLEAVDAAGRRAFAVCNMRFHPGPAALRKALASVGKPLFARAHFGNYLPAMRPGRDYRELYAARRAQGGGVVLDAVHEIDYLTWLFGCVESAACHAAKLSDLDLDVEDHALLSLHHANGVDASVELDYLRPRKSRGCEIVGTEGVLAWTSDGKDPERCTVRLYRNDSGAWADIADIAAVDTGRPYRDLMQAFLEEVAHPGTHPLASAKDAAAVLATALAALDSAADRGATRKPHYERASP